MAHIHILSDTLISQIAAGEVVERPASVVKELLENSLDAGATQCTIEVEQGGMKLIAVRDNGSGMEPEDAVMAFTRHATSKITSAEDLFAIKSFGFRGEALAAIASVSQMTLRTRQLTSDAGTEGVFEGGLMKSQGAIGCPPGTEILVRNLFFNTPARKKFLKAETTELSHIVAVVSHLALDNPLVGFSLTHNGKQLLSVPQNSTKIARFAAIVGKKMVEEVLPVTFTTPSITINGFIGKPGAELASRRHQYLFVNGRDVTDSLVARAVIDAYGSRLPGRTYPLFVLHIQLPPSDVDVNVHPRKLMVKFLDTQRIYRDTSQAVTQALAAYEQRIASAGVQMPPIAEVTSFTPFGFGSEQFSFEMKGAVQSQDALHSTAIRTAECLAQLANSYLLIADEQGLALVDQHAAHERIMYESFKRRAEEPVATQPLLVPLTIECSPEESLFLTDALEHLTAMGFEFDAWSGGTFVMRACPTSLKKENLEKVFRSFLDDVSSERVHKNILPEKLLKSLACKAAVKFGMPLTKEEQQKLLVELAQTPNSATCPHGRPTRVLVTFDELERRFYRRK